MIRTKSSLLLRLIWTKRHFGAWQANASRSHNVVMNWLVVPFVASLKKLTQFFVSIIFLIFDQRSLSINGRGLTPKEFLLFVLSFNAVLNLTTLNIGAVERIHDKFISDTIYAIISAILIFIFIAYMAAAMVVSARAFGAHVSLYRSFTATVYFIGYFIIVINFLIYPFDNYTHTANAMLNMVVQKKLMSAISLSILHDGLIAAIVFALYYLMYVNVIQFKLRITSWICIYLLSEAIAGTALIMTIIPLYFMNSVIGGFSFQLSKTISFYSPPLITFLVMRVLQP